MDRPLVSFLNALTKFSDVTDQQQTEPVPRVRELKTALEVSSLPDDEGGRTSAQCTALLHVTTFGGLCLVPGLLPIVTELFAETGFMNGAGNPHDTVGQCPRAATGVTLRQSESYRQGIRSTISAVTLMTEIRV